MAGVSYGLLAGVPLVTVAIVCSFVLQRRAMIRSEHLAVGIERLIRAGEHEAAVDLCLAARAAPAARVCLCLLGLRLGRTSERDADAAASGSFAERLSAVRSAVVAAVQSDQQRVTLLGIVCGLSGSLAGVSAAIDPTVPGSGSVVLALAGLLAAAFAWQRWRTLHVGIAVVGQAVERLVVAEEELSDGARAARERAERLLRQREPELARLVSSQVADRSHASAPDE